MGRTQGYCSGQPPGTEPARAARPPSGCPALHCVGARRTGQATGKTGGFAAAGVTSRGYSPCPASEHALERWQRAGPALTPEDECAYRKRDGQRRTAQDQSVFCRAAPFCPEPIGEDRPRRAVTPHTYRALFGAYASETRSRSCAAYWSEGSRIFRPEQLCTAPGRAGTLCRSSRAVPSKRQPWSRTNTKQ